MIRKNARRSLPWMALAGSLATTPAAAQEAPIAAPSPASASETSASEGQRYEPDYFARFAPRTALDMVEKLPGFTITGQGGGDRGLGAARENILINGERIANKSTDARTALSRISASQVQYVAIVDGASINVPGLTGQVANVVLVAGTGGGFKTTFRWQPEIRPRIQKNWLNGEISTTGKIGGSDLTISLTNDASRNGNWGPEQVFDAGGVLQFTRDEKGHFYGDRPRLAVALARTAANGNKLNVNAGGQIVRINNQAVGTAIIPGFGPTSELYRFHEREWNADFGGDYEFTLGGGRLKLIGLQRFEHSPTVGRFTVDRGPGGRVGNRFSQTADEGESILRGEYGWRTAGGTDWQIALEGAYNFLDVDAELANLQPDGSYRPVIFGGERTKVQEKRSEASLTWGRALADNLTAQINVGAEYSQLSSSGPGGLTRSFIRTKGKLALAWKVGTNTTINYELQRRVDQLNFYDFASSVDVANNQGNTGNGSLVPPQINRTQVEVVQNFGRWGNASLALAYAKAVDLVDQIPLSPTTEGRGNLAPANLYRISSKATLLLDPLGWKGARINGEAVWRRNRVRDPLTNLWRDQSGGQEYVIDVQLRHDIPGSDLAWGAGYYHDRQSPRLRLDAIENEYRIRPFVTAFIEHKNVAGLTVRASFRNLANQIDGFDRINFINRRNGPMDFSEISRRTFGRSFELTVTGTI